jgi:hypothetical protein
MAEENEVPTDTRVVPTDAGGSGEAPPATTPSADPKVGDKPAAPAAAAPAPAAAPDKPAEPKPDKPGAIGDDWREKLSNADEKKLSRLAKYQSPHAVVDALIAAQDLIAKGGHKKGITKDSTPEEIKAYREQMGVPESADKYKVEVTVPDNDKELVNTFLSEAVTAGMTDAQVNTTLKVMYAEQAKAEEKQQDDDYRVMNESEETLRAEWGGEYKRNITLIKSLCGDIADNLLTGRLADGTPVGSSPEVLRFLAGIALERNPMGVIVPGGGENMAASVEDEITKIEKVMRENRPAYNKDEKMQERYRQLLTFKEQSGGRKVA